MSSTINLKDNQTLEYLKIVHLESLNDIEVGNLVNGYKLADEIANTLMVSILNVNLINDSVS